MEGICLFTVAKRGDKYLRRWLKCARSLLYPEVKILVATDHDELAVKLRKHNIQVCDVSCVWRPHGTKSKIFRIVANRETGRKYFLNNMSEGWFLSIDSDLWFPCDTIERLLAMKTDLVWSRYTGLVWFARRKVMKCFGFVTAVCPDDEEIYVEEWTAAEKQLDIINEEHQKRHGKLYFNVSQFRCGWMRHKDYRMGDFHGSQNPKPYGT